MSITTEQIDAAVADASVHFHPVALDADGRPRYRIGNQLRKLAMANDTQLGELRWSRTKKGIWTVSLAVSGKIVQSVELGKKRDLRDPRMMTMLRSQYRSLIETAIIESEVKAAAEAEAANAEAAPAAA
jgi:hypothetical protein